MAPTVELFQGLSCNIDSPSFIQPLFYLYDKLIVR